MTPYIEAKKAEIKEKFRKHAYDVLGLEVDPRGQDEMYLIRDEDGQVTDGIEFSEELDEMSKFLDEIVDTLLDEIESRVVPMEALPSDWDDDDKPRLRASMYNQCRKDVTEAFQHLRTGGDITN